MHRSIIIGSGACIPENIICNSDFLSHEFHSQNSAPEENTPARIIKKFAKITGILERRYAPEELSASHLAAKAAAKAISDSGIDKESLDQVIVAHNFGDMKKGVSSPDLVPSLASRVKRQLGISNPSCVPYDLVFGCPGWLQGMIHADAFFKAGMAKTALIIGAETLSRVLDPHDRDSMIFSDGAGAIVLSYEEVNDQTTGLLSASVRSDCGEETDYIYMGNSLGAKKATHTQYLKMKGRKVYEYALRHVPVAMKDCLDKAGHPIEHLKAIFIHQANEKMDEAIVKSFYGLYGIDEPPATIMPMCIQWLGNSSVATIPTLFDLVRKSLLPGFELKKGDLVLFASVGAGMNINAVCYGYH
ncbi:3-oxoacyl-ACP synthase III family protein [Puia dinghuensis]|uniref:3-oxoacyl-ACP synthase n=1 Tax=Puia dinghuensis TaxID=1792502 RepID=A0A8J2XP46_9BACT|nr:ketoacyl-ACP synthase III [Puia dinghuensis]GGA86538.1 3-oxoacyl-ACP synthase [Puia dinghuensis]